MKIDCSKTENFLRELERMIDYGNKFGMLLFNEYASIENRIEQVQQWSDTHQRKTILEEFKERYPDAKEHILPCHLGLVKSILNDCGECITDESCQDCWSQPVPEVEG